MSTLIDDEIGREDDRFVSKATNPASRAAEIVVLTKRRKISHWVVFIATIAYVMFGSLESKEASATTLLIICILWASYFKLESDLRLLRIIDRIQKNERPVA
jgi:uncharacterized protein YybS (DUF2232 family)